MRRLLIILVTLLLAASFSFTTGEKEVGMEEEGELTFMVGGAPNEIAFFEEEVLPGFKEETGRDVTLIRQTTQTEQRKQSLLVALRGQETI